MQMRGLISLVNDNQADYKFKEIFIVCLLRLKCKQSTQKGHFPAIDVYDNIKYRRCQGRATITKHSPTVSHRGRAKV